MANKELILKSDLGLNEKAVMALLCTAQDINAEISRKLIKAGISQEQLQVLHILDESSEGVLTVNQIKSAFITDNPNISRMLNKLVEKKMIRKERDMDDQRIVFVQITEKGKKMHQSADEILLEAMPKLKKSEADSILKILMKI